MKKNIIIIIALFILATNSKSYSQTTITVEPRVNVATAAIGILDMGVEFGVSKHSAAQIEFLGSFYGSNFLGTGKPLLASIGYLDYKYYIKEEHKGLFFGSTLGYGTWRFSKGIIPGYNKSTNDVGSSLLLGVNLGYKFLIKNRLGIEISVAGGWVHSNHQGYNEHGELVFYSNRSDEFLPFKGGIYLTYRIGANKN